MESSILKLLLLVTSRPLISLFSLGTFSLVSYSIGILCIIKKNNAMYSEICFTTGSPEVYLA